MIYESAEVVETSKAYKSDNKDDSGKKLPLGAIKVRLHNHKGVGNVDTFYARPFGYIKSIPLLGEHVMVFKGPVGNWSDPLTSAQDWYYLPQPLNINNDPTYNVLQHSFYRAREGADAPIIPKKPGVTFPFPPRPTGFRQAYEGDTLIQSRFNSSIRLGSTVKGNMSIYDERPTWKGSSNGDPIIIMSIKDPVPGNKSLPPEYKKGKDTSREIESTNKYDVEDIGKDVSSIYLTSTQKLSNLKLGRRSPRMVKDASRYDKPQIILDTGRIVLNAKSDDVFVVANKDLVNTGNAIRLTTNKHDVDFDEFVDIVHDLVKEVKNLTTSTAMFTTLVGPTGPATNAAKLNRLFYRVKRLKSRSAPVNLNLTPSASNYKLGSDGIDVDPDTSKPKFNSASTPSGGNNPSQNSSNPTTNPSNNGPFSDSPSGGGGSSSGRGGGANRPGARGGGGDGEVGLRSGGSSTPPVPRPVQNASSNSGITINITPEDLEAGLNGPVSLNVEYDSICVSSRPPTDSEENPSNDTGGACSGVLYEMRGTIASLNEDNTFNDSVYLLRVDSGNCDKGWYSIGSKKIHKIVERDLLTVRRNNIKGYCDKKFLSSDCIKSIVYDAIYKECFYFVEYKLIDLRKRITLI